MKYCNRCFRNIIDDVNVCPFCGQADKLIDYDKEKRGEDFSCNNESTLSSHIDRDDAYSIGDESADAVYGNEKSHNLDNCENSAENEDGFADKGTPGENFKYSLDYFRKLPPAQRQALIQKYKTEIEQKYGYNPSDGTTVEVAGREISVAQFRSIDKLFSSVDTGKSETMDPEKAKKLASVFVVLSIIAAIVPYIGIPLFVMGIVYVIKSQTKNMSK